MIYDKNKRPIYVGDVLKVFHFTGRRRKKHYMYKQVVGKEFGKYKISHLSPDLKPSFYWYMDDGSIYQDAEIVQGQNHPLDNEFKIMNLSLCLSKTDPN